MISLLIKCTLNLVLILTATNTLRLALSTDNVITEMHESLLGIEFLFLTIAAALVSKLPREWSFSVGLYRLTFSLFGVLVICIPEKYLENTCYDLSIYLVYRRYY
jgi:hypothetical protein